MDRRDFLLLSAAASASSLSISGCSDTDQWDLPAKPDAPRSESGRRKIPWQNWSGYLRSYPEDKTSPKTEDELAELLKNATGTVRPVGASHSFSPLVPTDDTIVTLRHFQGLRNHDAEALTATFGAGTKLGDVGEPLHGVGQSLPNMPDIDAQTLAGAMATGTHGTSQHLGALHSFIESLRLVTPQGDILTCSENHNRDVFKAAQVSLGSLGVITEYTLRNAPTEKMKRSSFMLPIEEFFESFDDLAENNHSVDAYYIPFCDTALVVTINPTDEPIKPRLGDPDASAVDDMRMLRDYLGNWPGLRRWLLNKATGSFPIEESVDWWHRVYPSERAVRFNEMEYHMDREHLLPTLRKVRATLEANHSEVFFPVEIRVVKGDDAWLSPFYGHESASIAVHRFYKEDPMPLFNSIEPLYQEIAGRPHWGKMNTLGAAELAARYPMWESFQEVRRSLDPQGKMLNSYLKGIFKA